MRALLDDLRRELPADRLLLDPDLIGGFVHDEAEWAPHGMPCAVVRPRTSGEVLTVVRACLRHRAPVVPRGAGTGLSGGANAIEGGVVVCTSLMTEIREIDPVERLAVVQPGVVNDDLRAACAERDLWYPPDPASAPWSTIGGTWRPTPAASAVPSTGSPGTMCSGWQWSPAPANCSGLAGAPPRASRATTSPG